MGLLGADPAHLEGLAAYLGRLAERLAQDEARITASFREVPWHGPQAEATRADWRERRSPALKQAADSLRRQALDLRRHAAEQRSASEAGGMGPLSAGVRGPTPTASHPALSGPAGAAAVERELAKAEGITRASTKVLPGASAMLAAWAEELRTGSPSEADLAAFTKFRELVKLAMGQRATVGSAAESAANSFEHAAMKSADAGVGLIGVSGLSRLDSGVGKYSGGFAGTHNATIQSLEVIARGTELGVASGAKLAVDNVVDILPIKLTDVDPIAIRRMYEASADNFLAQAAEQLRNSGSTFKVDPEQVRANSLNEFEGHYAVAAAKGELGGSFDLGPAPLKEALEVSVGALIPGADRAVAATFVALDGAEAGYDVKAGIGYLNVATDKSIDQLERSLEAMRP